MAQVEALDVLREWWPRVLSALPAPAALNAIAAAEQIIAAQTPRDRRRYGQVLLRAVRSGLRASHPVSVALDQGGGGVRGPVEAGAIDRALDSLRDVLAEVDERFGPPPDVILARAQAILLAAPSYTPAEVAARGGHPDAPYLLRLPAGPDAVRMPRFQFDERGQPRPIVLQVNRMLGVDEDPWGVADWWLRGHAELGGVPADLLDTLPDQEFTNVAWSEVEDW